MRGARGRAAPPPVDDDPVFGPPPGDDYIREVTTRNVVDMPFPAFLEALRPHLLERVPEGIMGDEAALRLVDQQIGRFANIYAYLSVLYGFVGAEARRFKPLDQGRYDSLMAKKDALYRFLQAVELKWRACSRQVTVETESEVGFERPNYQAREERARRGAPAAHSRGWDAVRP